MMKRGKLESVTIGEGSDCPLTFEMNQHYWPICVSFKVKTGTLNITIHHSYSREEVKELAEALNEFLNNTKSPE